MLIFIRFGGKSETELLLKTLIRVYCVTVYPADVLIHRRLHPSLLDVKISGREQVKTDCDGW